MAKAILINIYRPFVCIDNCLTIVVVSGCAPKQALDDRCDYLLFLAFSYRTPRYFSEGNGAPAHPLNKNKPVLLGRDFK